MATSRFDLGALRSRDELVAVGKGIAAEIKNDDVPSLAAAISFKIVLALFPALLAAVAIYALVTDPNEIMALLDNVPDEITEVVEDQLREFIDQAASGGVAIAGIAIGIWAATGAAVTLNKALSRAYDVGEDRKLVKARAIALAVTAALLFALIGMSLLLVAGGAIENRILGSLPITETARATVDFASTVGRYVAAIALLMVLFAFIYWIGPDYERRPKWPWITPGAAVAVVTWLVASGIFGWYVANFGSYTDADSPYGPLGSAIVFMLWLQLSMFALLLGAEINQVLVTRARARRPVQDTADAGSVGATDAATSVPAAAVAVTGGASASSEARGTTTAERRDGTLPTPRDPYPTPGAPHGAGRTLAFVDHDVAASGDGDRPTAGDRGDQVPTETKVAAGLAAVSSVVGLAGLLRRLKGG